MDSRELSVNESTVYSLQSTEKRYRGIVIGLLVVGYKGITV
jgi:hypothetical protein